MDITKVLNGKGPAAAAAAERHLQQQLSQAVHSNGQTTSGPRLQHAVIPPSHPVRHAARSGQPVQVLSNVSNGDLYQYSTQLQQPVSAPVLNSSHQQPRFYESQVVQQRTLRPLSDNSEQPSSIEPLKAFACTTCSKGFARRSDLARHERIHSGVRPHACDFPGCDKSFIQRSALTVHTRVHSGEKPHMCERCGKPFSDSSSLARHRRIHSGKRPYVCPFADCQKTFTRRTTLTRHQNHHTGTVEEAAAATAAALASRPSGHGHDLEAEAAAHSDAGSAMSERTPSRSPPNESPQVPSLPRQTDYPGSLPPHMRGEYSQSSSRSPTSTASPTLSSFGGPQQRTSMTSHPSLYGPPLTLEPPTNHEHRPLGSVTGSPHIGSMGWHSPLHSGMPSPGPADHYTYQEIPYGAHASHLYYPNPNIRRGQSQESDYDMKPRMVGGEMWAAQA